MQNQEKLSATSDIAVLQKVIVHHPDNGIEWVTPSNKDFLLYDDIVYLPKMQNEHHQFMKLMELFVGKGNVVDIVEMLAEIIENRDLAISMLECIANLENLDGPTLEILKGLPTKELAEALISGFKVGDNIIIQPCPNLIFTRDIGVLVQDHLLVCFAAKNPRKRENIITWFVLHHHEAFKSYQESNSFIDISTTAQSLVENLKTGELSFEGGDIMMLAPKHMIIGCSERTNLAGILALRDVCFQKGVLDKITMVDIPKDEYCMHLDTIFTPIDTQDFVVFDKILLDSTQFKIDQYQKGKDEPVRFATLHELLSREFVNANFVHCGGGQSPYDEREQWTMACNTVAMKPGVVISYFRNPKTMAGFQEAGYQILDGEKLIADVEAGKVNVNEIEKTIITFFAGELCRAGGGPHCLTFPIGRK
jgi:arginine deiminase